MQFMEDPSARARIGVTASAAAARTLPRAQVVAGGRVRRHRGAGGAPRGYAASPCRTPTETPRTTVRAPARHWPARPPTSRAHTAPNSRDRPPRRRAPPAAGRPGSPHGRPNRESRTGTRRCRPPATAYPALRGCWHHGARWTSWTSSGCRRTVGLCSLFGGRNTSPRPTARDQRREVEKRERRGRVPRLCPHAVARLCRTAPP